MNYTILVIEEPSGGEGKDTASVYRDLISSGELEGIFGQGFSGSVSVAASLSEAEEILERLKGSPMIQILHLPLDIAGEGGAGFVERMRATYPERDILAFLIVNDPEDGPILNGLERRPTRYLSRPLDPAAIKDHLTSLMERIRLLKRPEGRCFEGQIHFRRLESREDLWAFLRLRFDFWEKLGYIPEENFSHKTRMEIDEYDRRSIPLGGFQGEDGKERLVTAMRIITTRDQESYIDRYSEILQTEGDDILRRAFDAEIESPFLIKMNYQLDPFFASLGLSDEDCVEYSRYISARRGLGLSVAISAFQHAYARDVLRKALGFAQCRSEHVEMNIRNGFQGVIPGTEPTEDGRVRQWGRALFIDLKSIHNRPPIFPRVFVDAVSARFRRDGDFTYCKDATRCVDFGIEYHDSLYCA